MKMISTPVGTSDTQGSLRYMFCQWCGVRMESYRMGSPYCCEKCWKGWKGIYEGEIGKWDRMYKVPRF